MSKSLVRPKDILCTLKQKDPTNATTLKAIYNARQKYKVVEKGGRTQMQFLLEKLKEYNYFEWHRTFSGDSDTVMDIFWLHPLSLDLLRTFPHVLILDCTYKTNRYRLPLFEVVGVTSTNMTFSIAFAYLASEKTDHYEWVLRRLRALMEDIGAELPRVMLTDRELALMSAIDRVFPTSRHLLCRWHINKNVAANCKKLFDTKESWDQFLHHWSLLVMTDTEADYERHLEETCSKKCAFFPSYEVCDGKLANSIS